MPPQGFSLAVLLVLGCVLWAHPALAKDTTGSDRPGRLNPFECYGRAQSAVGNRTMEQIEIELKKKLDQLDRTEPSSVKAMKYCVVARLKARLGHGDASRWFERAILAEPSEPGYELFFGIYWANQRGARAPIEGAAEGHLFRSLEKLEALRRDGQYQSYHDVVERWTQKRLLVLHQTDGQPVLPTKAYPNRAWGRNHLGLFYSLELQVTRDTSDFFHSSPIQTFTGEQVFAESDLRAQRSLSARERYDLARAPLRTRIRQRVRLRQRHLGAVDLGFMRDDAQEAQVETFYDPTAALADTRVDKLYGAYHRSLPLYPLFDAHLEVELARISRRGILEFLPEEEETFHAIELSPSLSRFVGPDKLTLDLEYTFMDIADLPGGVAEQALREKVIRGVALDYTFYSPLTLLSLDSKGVYRERLFTRGLGLYAGFVQDDEVYGTRRVRRRDTYAGVHYGGAGRWDLRLQASHKQSHTIYVDPNDSAPVELTDPGQTFSSLGGTLIPRVRAISADAQPEVGDTTLGFTAEGLAFVFPITWEQAISGPKDFENGRAGVEAWFQLFQLATWGSAWLVTLGYEFQYFHRINKAIHAGEVALRIGWEDL